MIHTLNKYFHTLQELARKRDGYTALIINFSISQFALGMLNLFGVIYIFGLGGSLETGTWYVILFFAGQRLATLVFADLVAKFVSKVGYRWPMFVSLMLAVAKVFLLIGAGPGNLLPLIPAAILGGIAIPAYYIPFHAIFLDDDDEKRVGEQSGLLLMLGRLANVSAPVISGLLVSFLGFDAMFLVAIFVLLVSAIPLFAMKHHKRHTETYALVKVFSFLKENKKVFSAMTYWSVSDGIQSFLWPVYMFVVLGGYVILGVVGSIVMIANSIAIFLMGKVYDKGANKKLFLTSGVVMSATWVARFLSTTPFSVAISDVANRFVSPLWWMKIKRQEFLRGERADSVVFGVAHEYSISVGYIAGAALGAVVVFLGAAGWVWLSIPAVFASLYATFLMRNE